MKTYIPGKDAALEESINRFEEKLTAHGFHVEPVSWLNPVPNVWSVHIRDVDAPMNFTNGKGASKKAALASALGEYFERLSCNYFYADFYMGDDVANAPFVHYPNEKWFPLTDDDSLPEGLLDDAMSAFYDPEDTLAASELIDLQSGNEERGICALPFERQRDQHTVYVPMNVIGNLYVSNGMSAGNTQTEARSQALSEVFERAIKNRIIAERISLPEIPADVMARYPSVQASIDALIAEGFPVVAYDASLGGKYPVICVALFNPNNGTCFTSWGAHPRFQVALERTVTELLQGRSLKDLDVFEAPSFHDEDVADHHNLETHFIDSSGTVSWDMFKATADIEFADWNFEGTSQEECDWLLGKLHAEDADAYIADYTHLDVNCCRVIVPGWSEIYPPEEIQLCNNNRGTDLRDALSMLLASEYSDESVEFLFDVLEMADFDDSYMVCELMGIAPDANTAWKSLTIGELKCLLALAMGDLESAQDFAVWSLDYNATIYSQPRAIFMRCLIASLELAQDDVRDPAEYRQAFGFIYGEETTDAVWDSISGDIRFFGLTAPDADLTAFSAHQKLLGSYNKLQIAKATLS
ncbi:ribosomal protein S12 methylthiotransferase accessory factor YcaO [Enterovibrio norvegicus]|uniref:30S ribosomal protein S12 methylthiotransferase accessory factor YcaO n=1 Tax=Enterovibrio norvegicus TaxID=188144 RepID=UPI00031E5BDB|nr:30S ribosomal protein S12 methylthiotransferase accessory factor YcaO [Enterovibrio norvegicus]MCC4801034.1 30S ribosomal protein S12 methylthiotransferase accessory protein YcaO [Enterovibrio norvegicus]OEE65607.1 ribosomal protein S12 methylthiotransferase accessory factor YcaO [Enterovibrio norvegicus]PMH60110.1 ribosomal protein S12 methylthiotransferase accessory factor YcaO [Enterovibrio norvegicus]PMI33476.1 ribosomal protein S12 methylthiotransferase accessory factor YcaO [Enterovibr